MSVQANAAITAGLVFGFAGLFTAHVATLFGLAKAPPRSRALAGLVVPPLAPYWALRAGMRVRAILWIAFAAVYGVAFVLAR